MENPCNDCRRYGICTLSVKDSKTLTHCDLRLPSKNTTWKQIKHGEGGMRKDE